MFARVATFEGVDIAAAERVQDEVRQRAEPLLRELPGSQGFMQLVDRSGGKFVTISFFDSEENMQAAEQTFEEEMPRRLGDLMEPFAGTRSSVERYEVAVDERL